MQLDAAFGDFAESDLAAYHVPRTAVAIGNAVHHATGVRHRELPLTPDRVLKGLTGAP